VAPPGTASGRVGLDQGASDAGRPRSKGPRPVRADASARSFVRGQVYRGAVQPSRSGHHLSRSDTVALRLMSLLLAPRPDGYPGDPAPKDVAGVVTWLGAMQAQDHGSAAWSFGV